MMQTFARAIKGKVIAVLFLVALALQPGTAFAQDWSAFGEDYPYLEASEAMVMDSNGNVLFSRNADTIMSMASITKVMTAVVALESGVSLQESIMVSDSVLLLDPESSVIGYQPGEVVSFAELIWGLLVHSGNDAALVISELIAGSEAAFVDLMNARALELGLYNTRFANPHGLDQAGHYSTASDLIKLGMYAMDIPLFASIVGCPSTTVTVAGQPVVFSSTNEFLNVYPGMRGIKTGYTYGAGRAFLGVTTRGGATLYYCVLGTSSNEARWADVQRLLDWSFLHYAEHQLLSSTVDAMGSVGCADRFGWVYPTSTMVSAAYRVSPFAAPGPIGLDVSFDSSVRAAAGQHVGQLLWCDPTYSVYVSRSLYAADHVVPDTLASTNDFYGLDRF